MANEKYIDKQTSGNQTSELDECAFEIFKESVARSPVNRGGEQLARASYKKAEAFLATRERVRSGELKQAKPEGPQLNEFCCPNRPKTDPHNLVSTKFGNLDTVNRVKKWLDQNPTPESDPMDIVHRFKGAFGDLQWGNSDEQMLAAITTARVIFPAFCKS